MNNLIPELIAKAKAAENAEEILELAKANNVELTEEEAKIIFEQLHANGAISDDELDNVAGGQSCPGSDDSGVLVLKKRVKIIDGGMYPGNRGLLDEVINRINKTGFDVICERPTAYSTPKPGEKARVDYL